MSQPEKFDDALSQLWKTQEVDRMEITLDVVMKKSHKLETSVYWRNMREWIGCAIVIPVLAWMAWGEQNLAVQIGLLTFIPTAISVAYRLYRDGRILQSPDPAASTADYLSAYQRELLHQAELLQKVPTWYLGPFVPGMLIIVVGRLVENVQAGNSHIGWFISQAIIIVIFAGVWYLNRRAVRQLREEAATLDANRE